MSLLPKLLGSQWADILLTEGEESGKSTAQDFVMPEGKQYNWMVEFDRMGSYLTVKSSHGKTEIRNEDAVLYKYGENFKEATPFKEALTNSGYEKLGTGTFTDICHLQEVGCKGMNVAVGYHNNHSTKAYMYMVEYIRAVNLFTKFYKSYQGTRFPHTEVKRVFTSRTHTYHNPYKKHKFDKTGWMKEATFQPGDIVEYKSYSKRIYIVDDVKRIEDADAKYPRYLVDLVYPDGGVYLANVSDSEITAKESACILCLGTSKPTITIMDTDDTYINLCPYCYQIGIGVLPQCDSCHIELELDDVITLGDGYVSCEDCLFDEEMEISDSRIWIGDIVKMNDGNRLFFVHDLLSGGRSNSLRVTLAAVDTGEIFTNASRGYEADIFTIISKGEIVDDIYNTK
jgi:hypothetical protein